MILHQARVCVSTHMHTHTICTVRSCNCRFHSGCTANSKGAARTDAQIMELVISMVYIMFPFFKLSAQMGLLVGHEANGLCTWSYLSLLSCCFCGFQFGSHWDLVQYVSLRHAVTMCEAAFRGTPIFALSPKNILEMDCQGLIHTAIST